MGLLMKIIHFIHSFFFRLTKRLLFYIIAVLIAVLTFSIANAAVLTLQAGVDSYDPAPYIEIYLDKTKKLTVENVSASSFQAHFSSMNNKAIHLDPQAANWIRFGIKPGKRTGETWLLEIGHYRFDEITLYLAESGEVTGFREIYPIPNKEMNHRGVLFELLSDRAAVRTFYLRLASHASMPVPLTLWQKDSFGKSNLRYSMVLAAVYGVLLSMSIFNLFIFLSLRDRMYLLYVAYIFSMLLYLISLNGQHLFLFNLDPETALLWLWRYLGCAIFFAMVFIKAFLSTKESSPRLNHALSLTQVVGAVIFVFGHLGLNSQAHIAALIGGVGITVTGLSAGVIRLLQGYRPALYFLLAWTALLIGALTLPLKEFAVIPQSVPSELGTNLGAAAEAVLLSFALADRIRILRKEKESLTVSQQQYLMASLTDGLTGLFNVRYLKDRLVDEAHCAQVEGRPFCLMMMDVDDFKHFNDAYGHQCGDEVLMKLARLLKFYARSKDAPCRYGGEEFLLALPDTNLAQTILVAERIRREFENQKYDVGLEQHAGATISIGAACLEPGDSLEDLIGKADANLYRAKKSGKNRVEADI